MHGHRILKSPDLLGRGGVRLEEQHVDERIDDVRQAINSLKPLDQEIIRLVHWDGFALVEAARLLGKRPSTIRSRYHRARGQVRVALEAHAVAPANADGPSTAKAPSPPG
jgi:RNA polymerase sigma-70 factor (ECF subfamily)